MNAHRLAEERSIAYHRAVAARLLADPSLVGKARDRVRARMMTRDIHPEYGAAWIDLLARPLSQIIEALTDRSELARALRQTTPFAGVVPARERWAIWREVQRDAEVTPR